MLAGVVAIGDVSAQMGVHEEKLDAVFVGGSDDVGDFSVLDFVGSRYDSMTIVIDWPDDAMVGRQDDRVTMWRRRVEFVQFELALLLARNGYSECESDGEDGTKHNFEN